MIDSGKSRHLRRGVLPARYIGLVSCSLALLGIGGVAYAASLPSLIDASHDSERQTMAYVVGNALFGSGVQTGAAGDGAASGDAGPEGGAESAAATDPSGKGKEEEVTFGGLVMQGINIVKPQGAAGAASQAEGKPAGQAGDAADKPAASKPTGGAASDKPSANKPSGGASSGSDEAASRPPAVSEEEEKRIRAALLVQVERIPGYVNELNAATQAFNNDLYADEATRAKRYREVDKLTGRLLEEWDIAVNKQLIPNESRYIGKQGDVIRMYRLLREYASILRESWRRNQGPIDTAAELDYIMEPIRKNESGGSNRQLQEFNQVYGSFSL